MTTKKPNSLKQKSSSELRPEVELDLMTNHDRAPEDVPTHRLTRTRAIRTASRRSLIAIPAHQSVMTTTPAPPQSVGCSCSSANDGPSGLSSELQEWLSPDDLVQLLRGSISLGTLRNYRSARIGPAYVRVGRGIFYPRSEVDAWLAEQVRESEDRWNDRY